MTNVSSMESYKPSLVVAVTYVCGVLLVAVCTSTCMPVCVMRMSEE